MSEERKLEMPATEGTQASVNAEAATPDLRQQMFGSKTSKKTGEADKSHEASGQPQASEPAAPLADGSPESNLENAGKKTKERVQELAREKNKWKSQAEAGTQEIERLQAELKQLQQIKENDKTNKEQLRELYIEEKLKEHIAQSESELREYISTLDEPDMFVENYNYYVPLFQDHDAWTLSQIEKFPEKNKMLDIFFQAMTNGVFSHDEWIKAPNPLKMQKILDLRDFARNKSAPANPVPQTPSKQIPDSTVPNLHTKHDPSKPPSKGSTFYKVFNRL